MRVWRIRFRTGVIFFTVTILLSIGLFRTEAQTDKQQIATRNLWNEAFTKQRPAPKKPLPVKTGKATPSSKEVAIMGDSFIGVTLWHMRKSVASDPVRFRGLVHPGSDGDVDEWTPERSPFEKPVPAGDYVRLSIESAKKGYLYVIDRDVYADGTESPADLIFPTTRLRKADNAVEPGTPVEIPDADDKPPVFRMERTRMAQTSVRLIVVVSPAPIAEVKVGRNAQRLPEDVVTAWQKRWGVCAQGLDATEDAGRVYTPKEQAAAKEHGVVLTEADPLPMTLFHCDNKKAEAMMIAAQIKLE